MDLFEPVPRINKFACSTFPPLRQKKIWSYTIIHWLKHRYNNSFHFYLKNASYATCLDPFWFSFSRKQIMFP